jgi:flavodoxin
VRSCVVYDSVQGNTETIARAVGEALPGEVQVVHVGQADPEDLAGVDLLILGSPTHGAMPTEAVQGLMARIGSPVREAARAATFDTRYTWTFLRRWGFAADKMVDPLRKKGWPVAAPPEGFIVKGLRTVTLKRGEAERAAVWARGLVGGAT